jgi:hypothetical protein
VVALDWFYLINEIFFKFLIEKKELIL